MNASLEDRIVKYSEDKDFIHWVNSNFQHNNSHWEQLRNSDAEALDAAVFLVQSISSFPKVENSRKQDLFERIETTIDSQKKPTVIRRLYPALAIAASFLLLITLFWPSGFEELETNRAQILSHALPDKSSLTLNAESELSYDSKKFKKTRSLNLAGEAFFEVEKGESFVVNTDLGSVEVLGTSFNVFSRDDRFEVACKTGKVKVSSKDGNSSVILTPGEECHLLDNQIVKLEKQFQSDEWIEGVIHFEDVRIEDVVAEIERQFDIILNTEAVTDTMPYTGFFLRSDLEKSLQYVFWPFNYRYEKTGDNEYTILK